MNRDALLAGLATRLGVATLEPDAHGICAVWMEDGLDLDIHFLPDSDELRLTLPLGQPAGETTEALATEALMANALLARTSRLHLAWEDSRQRLVICQTRRLDAQHAQTLAQDVDELVQACHLLRQQLLDAGVIGS